MSDQPGYPGYPSYPGPYAPPTPPFPAAPADRPETLRYVVYGMYLGAVLTLLSAALTLTHLDTIREVARHQVAAVPGSSLDPDSAANLAVTVGVASAVIGALVGLGLWIWMAVANGRGLAWSRVVATVFGGIDIVVAIFGLVGGTMVATKIPGTTIIDGIDLVLAIVLLVLLWRPECSRYYAAVTAAKRARRGYGPASAPVG